MTKFPKADPKSNVYKLLKVKNIELTVIDPTLGVAWNGDLYKIENGIATILR